jgi:uncharacterized protein
MSRLILRPFHLELAALTALLAAASPVAATAAKPGLVFADNASTPTQAPPASASSAGSTEACAGLPAPLPPFAGPEQIKASNQIDWRAALAPCQSAVAAKPGDPRLQYLLGLAFAGVKNDVEAARHYQVAADAGYAPAQTALGYQYVMGRGVLRNYERAFDLFSKAAEAGYGPAMGDLGSMYESGFFVQKNSAEGLAWYEKSIEAGDSFGLAQAGVAYFNGQGAERDYNAAAQYFQQAADMGDGYSMKFLAVMYERGLLGKADPAKAAQLRLKAAEVDPNSQDPVIPPPQKTVARTVRLAQARHVVRIRRYRFFGCTWMWC